MNNLSDYFPVSNFELPDDYETFLRFPEGEAILKRSFERANNFDLESDDELVSDYIKKDIADLIDLKCTNLNIVQKSILFDSIHISMAKAMEKVIIENSILNSLKSE